MRISAQFRNTVPRKLLEKPTGWSTPDATRRSFLPNYGAPLRVDNVGRGKYKTKPKMGLSTGRTLPLFPSPIRKENRSNTSLYARTSPSSSESKKSYALRSKKEFERKKRYLRNEQCCAP